MEQSIYNPKEGKQATRKGRCNQPTNRVHTNGAALATNVLFNQQRHNIRRLPPHTEMTSEFIH